MGISSLLNTALGNLNDLSLILRDDRLSMYNTIYIFLKLTCPIGKKTKTYFLIKKHFLKPKIWLVQLKEGNIVKLCKSILKLVIPDTKQDHFHKKVSSDGKTPVLTNVFKIMAKDLRIAGPQIFLTYVC